MGKSVDVMDALNSKPQNDGLVSQGTMDKFTNGLRAIGIPVGGVTNDGHTTSGLDAAMQTQANKIHPVKGK